MASAYERIVHDIGRRIADGGLAAGDRVPSTRQLVADYGVAMATATKALTALRASGLVRAVPGVGTVVAETPTRQAAVDSSTRGTGTVAGSVGRAATGDHEVSRDRVVGAAIALADAEGIAGLSMRRVAAEIGIATMSVYRYVANRDELVSAMADAAIAEHRLPADPPTGVRTQLETAARLMWASCRAHPWLASAMSITRPQLLPHGMDYTEWLLAAVDGYDMDVETRMHIGITLLMYVRGVAVNIEPELRARQDTGLTDEEWMDTQKPAMETLTGSVRYPRLSGIVGTELDITLDSLFEFGLERLLDGLDGLLAAHQ